MASKKFDPDKDEVLAEIGRVEGARNSIVCRVVSYDGADAKVQLNRVYTAKDGEERFTNLGRVAADDLQGVIDLLDEARAWFTENG